MLPNCTRHEKDREARRNKMRKRILKAAMDLFLKQGFENVTIRKIASAIGYSPGAIYRYFTDKDEIFFALRGQGYSLFYEAQVRARKSKSARVRLQQHAEAYIDFALSNPEYYEMMFMMQAPMERVAENQEWLESVRSLDLLREDVRMAMESGVMRPSPVDAAALTLWSALHGAVSLLLRGRLSHLPYPERNELMRSILDFLFRNLTVGRKK